MVPTTDEATVICGVCDDDYLPSDDYTSCIAECDSDQVRLEDVCTDCPDNCETCSAADVCSECAATYEVTDDATGC